MAAEPKKKRRRGPFFKNTVEVEDKSELTLSTNSSFANLQEESSETTSSSTLCRHGQP